MKSFKGIVAAVLVALVIGGCAPVVLVGVGAAAGVSGVKYFEGALTVHYEASFDRTWSAVEKSLERHKVRVDLRQREMGSGKLSGQDFRGRPITITVQYVAPEETKAIIRVGHLGDREESRAFKEDIRKILFP